MMPSITHSNDTEDVIVSGMQTGNNKAFSQLYKHYAPALLGYIIRITGDKRSSETVLQKALIAIWNRRNEFCPASERLFTWMLKITKSIALEFRRSRMHNTEDSRDNTISAMASVTNPVQNRLLELIHFGNYSIQEASSLLKIEEDTARVALRSAISKLKSVK